MKQLWWQLFIRQTELKIRLSPSWLRWDYFFKFVVFFIKFLCFVFELDINFTTYDTLTSCVADYLFIFIKYISCLLPTLVQLTFQTGECSVTKKSHSSSRIEIRFCWQLESVVKLKFMILIRKLYYLLVDQAILCLVQKHIHLLLFFFLILWIVFQILFIFVILSKFKALIFMIWW